MGQEIAIQQNNWEIVKRQAKAFLMSGYLREEFTKGVSDQEALAKVVTIITVGDELGIGRMQALRSINVIKGKPALAAELMLALTYNRIPDFSVEFTTPVDKQHLECTAVFERRGKKSEFKWTMEDAKKAGLEFVSKQGFPTSWAKYPKAMLRARVITEGLRAIAPDATMGLVSLEEATHEVVETHPAETVTTISEPKTQPIPVPVKASTGNTVGYDERHTKRMAEPCTDKQVAMILGKMRKLEWGPGDITFYCKDRCGVETVNEFNKQQASSAIEELTEFLKPPSSDAESFEKSEEHHPV